MDLPQDFKRIKKLQHNRLYYVPEKDEFLRREKRTTATEEYRQYLKDSNPGLGDDRLEEAFFEALTQLHSVSYGKTVEEIINAVPRSLRLIGFTVTDEQEDELRDLLRRMLDGTRQEALRGKMYKYHKLSTTLEIIETEGLTPENISRIHSGKIDAMELVPQIELKQPDLAQQLATIYQQ
ncbi:hypothetical protein GM421_04585 [Lactobacillus delbrueckii]|nr:hypothetical protein GM421_04585 [Lactobacillus delbrueckii]